MGKKDYEKGQRDGSKGKYETPYSAVDALFSWGQSGRDGAQRATDYNKGVDHGKRNPKK